MSTPLLQSPRQRDGKLLTHEDGALVPFLKTCFVVVPVWLGVMLPLTLVTTAAGRVGKLFRGARPAADSDLYVCPAQLEEQLQQATKKPLAARTYDFVLLGATGFTGRLACKYMADTYGGGGGASGIRWAIAGRRAPALEAIKAELGLTCDVLVCDTSQPETLQAVVADTRVIATTAGPFARYGTPVVHAAASLGTGYVDITGESDWVRQTVDRYDDLAQSTGARIVHFCGHDCIPWDLTVMKVADKLREEHGQALQEVRLYDEIFSEASGGTMATIFHSLEDRQRYAASLKFDPMLKTADGTAGPKTATRNQGMSVGHRRDLGGKHVGPFIMAMVMANCVRRSNALNGYSAGAPKPLVYNEALVYPGFMAGVVNVMGLVAFGTALYCPPLRWLLQKFVLPKPGQGPSTKTMDAGFLNITAIGVGDGGAEVTMNMYFKTDPGYRDTARMLVESALTLGLEGDRVDPKGGVFTPASCLGDVLLERLVATGTEVEFQ